MAKQATSKDSSSSSKPRVGNKITAIISISLALMVFLSLLSFHPDDVTYLEQGFEGPPVWHNWIGYFGAVISRTLLLLFGLANYPVVVLCLFSSSRRACFTGRARPAGWEYWSAFLLILVGTAMLFGIWPDSLASVGADLGIASTAGGAVGQYLCGPERGILSTVLNPGGSGVIAATLIMVGVAVLWLYDWHDAFVVWHARIRERRNRVKEEEQEDSPREAAAAIKAGSRRARGALNEEENTRILRAREKEKEKVKKERAKTESKGMSSGDSGKNGKPSAREAARNRAGEKGGATYRGGYGDSGGRKKTKGKDLDYELPALELMDQSDDAVETTVAPEEVEKKKKILQATLDSFKIDARVGQATSGPRVTLFEVEPAPGVKVERISNLGNNIAMELQAQSLRILTPIPGRKSVGIEVPNQQAAVVSLRGLMNTPAWRNKKVAIPLLLGRSISGKPVLLDLTKAPHLLIAGATGSGKSVCINAMIMCLLYRFTPEEMRLILIDPKVVEFSGYNSLPHLAVPVITDSQKVVMALRWVIKEMERRYNLFAAAGARNISAFNARSKKNTGQKDQNGNEIPDRVPYIIVIIDELADIMMTSRSEIENSLARIAQLSRAVGIHTIVATQRPSVNVITGIIKANYPTRVAFQVTSQVDSRTILDGKGAEKLLGGGDMLFKPPGASQVQRNQSPMVEDHEIEAVAEHVSSQKEQHFIDDVFKTTGEGENGELSGELSDEDEKLIERAIDIILQDRRASTSYVQRCLRIGYNRAALIMEILEQRGVVGPQVGSASREILISRDEDADVDEEEPENGKEDEDKDDDAFENVREG